MDARLNVLALVSLAALVMLGCEDRCTTKSKYTYYEPVYATSTEIREAVGFESSREIIQLGKIYIKDNYLFVNDRGKGIHIFDNANPGSPVSLGFLSIPGNLDLAVLGDFLYADSFIDIVVFDISEIRQIKEVNRLEGFFDIHQFYFYDAQQDAFAVDWQLKEDVTIYESDCDLQAQPWGGVFYADGVLMAEASKATPFIATPGNSAGIGGSMARFTINQQHLYAMEHEKVHVIDITSPGNPTRGGSISLSWDIETIFPYENKLFVGSQSGMYIIDASQPAAPELISVYQHLRSCDPVVVEGDLAYVTLRNGTECAGFLNQLEVIDISDLSNPSLISVYEMTNPHGLGIDGGLLFICDGRDGLKVYDATDPHTIDKNLLAHYREIDAFDIIPYRKVAIMIGEDGLFQYDYSNVGEIKLLSMIPFAR